MAPNKPNTDLWNWIAQSLHDLGRERVQLRKVPAHRPVTSACSRHEAWRHFHNAMADRAARLANQARPTVFWDQWEQHVQATNNATTLSDQVRRLQLAVGHRNVRGGLAHEDAPAATVRTTRVFEAKFNLGPWTGEPVPGVSRLFGSDHVTRAKQWFSARVIAGVDNAVVWVSFVQLYIDFQLTWGNPGPVRVNGQWVDAATRRYLDVERFPFRQRVKWFKQFLKAWWKANKVDVTYEQCRPRSESLQAFLPAVAVPWCPRALFEVERWLMGHLKTPCVREADALRHLPLAHQSVAMRV